MDKTILVERKITDGRRLLEALDSAGVEVTAAYWYFQADPSLERWVLVIATPSLDYRGIWDTYREILGVLRSFPQNFSINLEEIQPIAPGSDGVNRLRTLFPEGIQNPTQERSIEEMATRHGFITGAYIYRLAPLKPNEEIAVF